MRSSFLGSEETILSPATMARKLQPDRRASRDRGVTTGRLGASATSITAGAAGLRRRNAAGHHHDPDDSLLVERQAHRKVALVRHLAGLAPAGDLPRPGDDVAPIVLELGRCLLQDQLLV